jgi:hypothetical protein
MSEHFSQAGADPRETEVLDLPRDGIAEPVGPAPSAKAPRSAWKPFRIWIAFLLVLLLSAGVYLLLNSRKGPEPAKPWPTRPVPLATRGLRVDAQPPGAMVSSDGEFRGLAPLVLESRSAKERPRVEASMPGFHPTQAVLRPSKEGSRVHDAVLERSFGYVDLSEAAGRKVFLDGRPVEEGASVIPLPVGLHEIRMEKQDTFWSDVRLIRVSAGMVISLPLKND